MMGGHAQSGPVESVAVLDRPESHGFWNVAWPLLMLGLITGMILQSCVPEPQQPSVQPKFDAAATAKVQNDKALAALSALPASPALADVLPLLNLIVVNFASGSAAVPEDAKPVLDVAAVVLSVVPLNTQVSIVGHTDDTGDSPSNQVLSVKRAQAVRDALAARGVSNQLFTVAGAGDSQPIASNTTEQGRFANRRIEFVNAPR